MKNKILTIIKSLLFIILIILPYQFCFAQDTITSNLDTKLFDQTQAFIGKSGFEAANEDSVSSVIAAIIQAFLGLLGIIFIVLIVMAGYKWMNAAGNEEKVQEAKDTIRRAIIGLIITVSAYAITYFVFTNLPGGGTTVPG